MKLIPLDSQIRVFYHYIKRVIANFYYGFPSRNMVIIGVTGTNGKTTTVNIIARGLKRAGKKVFMFSTVNYFIADEEFVNNTKMTSPDPFLLQKLLKEAQKKGCEYAIIETSSHALFYNRVWGIEYDIAVLTNITQDHLDLHKSMDNYVRTKLKLFKQLISKKRKPNIKKTAVINIDSNYKELFLSETYDAVYTYGFDYEAILRPKNIINNIDYTTFELKLLGSTLNVKTKLRGRHNVYNILRSIGVMSSLGFKDEQILQTILDVSVVPGRLEEINTYENFKIFIDYAHTPDALENVLLTLREIKGINRIFTVFGATGDRDKTKRPIMGEIVSKYSDYVVLTQDDDYSEKTQDIVKDILPGIDRKVGENFWIILDRESAIRHAMLMLKENDVLLIAGKGDEHIMVTNLGPVPYNDKDVVLKVLKLIDDNKIIN